MILRWVVQWRVHSGADIHARVSNRNKGSHNRLARTARVSTLKRTSHMAQVSRKADLPEVFNYIFIPEGPLCADGIGKDLCSQKIKKEHLLCIEHCCTWTRQSIVSGLWSEQRRLPNVPDENLAQSPVRFTILKLLSIGQLEKRGKRNR